MQSRKILRERKCIFPAYLIDLWSCALKPQMSTKFVCLHNRRFVEEIFTKYSEIK